MKIKNLRTGTVGKLVQEFHDGTAEVHVEYLCNGYRVSGRRYWKLWKPLRRANKPKRNLKLVVNR